MNLVRVGDELYDSETGEFAGLANTYLDGVSDEATLLTYLNRRLRYEAEVRAAEIEMDAIVANAAKHLEAKRKKLDWLNTRFESDAVLVAHTLLPRNGEGHITSKTLSTPYARIAFRTKSASVSIANEEAALGWALANNADAVKVTQKVLVSKLPTKDWVEEGRCPDGFEIVPEVESVTIKTIE